MRTRIKFCGCTNARDADLAVACGVDAIGVIFAGQSPRRVSAVTAREIARVVPPFVELIGVFVSPQPGEVADARESGYVPQFSGDEPAAACETSAGGSRYLKVHHVGAGRAVSEVVADFNARAPAYEHATWMLDTAIDGQYGGTGRTFDWDVAATLGAEHPIIVSGGLSPQNVAACVRRVRPFGVDVRSGIETDGVKDLSKMRAFVRAVKEADEEA